MKSIFCDIYTKKYPITRTTTLKKTQAEPLGITALLGSSNNGEESKSAEIL